MLIILIALTFCMLLACSNAATWTQFALSNDFASVGHSLHVDSSTSTLYLFGGSSDGALPASGVVYSLVMGETEWNILSSIDQGYERLDHSAVALATGAIIFGGLGSGGYFSDVWRYSKIGDSWNEVACTGNIPTGRKGHTGSLIGLSMLVFGGQDDSQSYQDLYQFRTDTSVWTLQDKSNKPPARSYHSSAVIGNCLYVFGGIDLTTYSILDDFWMTCQGEAFWTEISASPVPTKRRSHSAISVDGRMLVFGGYSGLWPADYLSDLHQYDPILDIWIPLSFDASPPGVTGSGLQYIPVSGQEPYTVVVGGQEKYTVQSAVSYTRYEPVTCDAGSYLLEDGVTCQQCSAGYYESSSGSYDCTICPAGSYAESTGSSSCDDCGVGYWSDQEGSTSSGNCNSCSEGTASNIGRSNTDTCSNCLAGTYCDHVACSTCDQCPTGTASSTIGATTSDTCQTCLAGTYSLAGASSCQQCIAGEYSGEDGADDCDQCVPGTWSDDGESECHFCLAGHYGPDFGGAGQASCLDCGPGRYEPDEGKSSCSLCPTGTYSTVVGATSIDVCSSCPVGTFNPAQGANELSDCQDCAVGTYNDVVGQSSCSDCPVGKYNELTGQSDPSSCLDCPVGTANPLTGRSSVSDCISCSPGSWSLGGVDVCFECPGGTYSTVTGSSTSNDCIDCPAYTYSEDGASDCLDCESDEFSEEGSSCTACTENPDMCQCQAGTFREGADCIVCEVGNYCVVGEQIPCPSLFFSFGGASACSPCLDGWLCTGGEALPCMEGTYADNDLGECVDCPPGSVCRDGDREVCPPGRYGPSDPTARHCLLCEPGTFTNEAGQTSCQVCIDGMTSNYARDGCVNCPAGEFSQGGSYCSSCPVGTWSDAGADSCTSCPGGQVTSRPGSSSISYCFDP